MIRAARFLAGLAGAFLAHLLLQRLTPDASRWVDLFAVVIVLNALGSGPAGAMIGGSVAGLAEDALAGLVYGLHGFAGTLTGFLVVLGTRLLTVQQGAVVAGMAGLAVLVQEVVITLLVRLLLADAQAPEPRWILLRAAVTGVVAGVFYTAGARSARRLTSWRRGRRQRVRIEG
jgi:cell shape-determining protein MreD